MRVLMMSDLAPDSRQGSGAERLVEVLAEGVRTHGHQVDIRTFYPNPPDASVLLDYDLVHIHNFSMMPVQFQHDLMKREHRSPPIIFTLHDYTYLCNERHGLNKRAYPCPFLYGDRSACGFCAPFNNYIEVGLLNDADLIVTDSQRMRWIYQKALPDATIKAIHLGIPVVEHPKDTRDYGRRTKFLYMGRHSFEKGIFEMLAAFKSFHAIVPEGRLVLTHDGRDTDAIKLMVDRAGLKDCVRFTGRVSRPVLETYITECVAVLAPSVWEEPFNLTIPEAWSHRRPVIASYIGAHTELIMMSNGGLLYPPYDINALVVAMSELYDFPDNADTLGKNGNKAHRDYFNQERLVTEYVKTYEDVTG